MAIADAYVMRLEISPPCLIHSLGPTACREWGRVILSTSWLRSVRGSDGDPGPNAQQVGRGAEARLRTPLF